MTEGRRSHFTLPIQRFPRIMVTGTWGVEIEQLVVVTRKQREKEHL